MIDARKNIHAELKPFVDPAPATVYSRDNISDARAMHAEARKHLAVPATNVTVESKVISKNGRDIKLHLYRPNDASNDGPALVWFHGGGYILGSSEDTQALLIADACGCTVISVDYRIAPEHPFPAGTNDGYDALQWVYENTQDLAIDAKRIAIGGASAGAGMAAGVALMNRDKDQLPLIFQFLLYPMIDNLHNTDSGKIENHPIWCRESSLNAWEMYLDGTPGEKASPYAAAYRANDLSDLPKTYIAVGTQDLFRDEDISFAQRLMAADVPTKLEVFPGVFHGAEAYFRDAKISKEMTTCYYKALRNGLMQDTK